MNKNIEKVLDKIIHYGTVVMVGITIGILLSLYALCVTNTAGAFDEAIFILKIMLSIPTISLIIIISLRVYYVVYESKL